MRSKAAVVLLVVLALLGGAGLLESEAQQPDPISTPTPAPPNIDPKLSAPAEVKSGGFMVTAEIPKGCAHRWRNDIPAGVVFAELLDLQGRHVLVFIQAPSGRYRFRLETQFPSIDPPLDPTGYAEWTVAVDGNLPEPEPEPNPEPEPTPDPEPPVDVHPLLAKLTERLNVSPQSAAMLRDFYARLATEVRNDTARGLKTVGGFQDWKNREEKAAFTGHQVTKIKGLAEAIGGYCEETMGIDDVPLDHDKAAKMLDELSAACGRAAK